MEEVIRKIQSLTEEELQEVMRTIETRYAKTYTDWDVVYIAVHKEPELRKRDFFDVLRLIDKDLAWHRKFMEEKGVSADTSKPGTY